MKNTGNYTNHLASENSPYLLQHAGNPVDWYPWGPEALDKARRENKPILLSIGYSACHWCHVMAHESFEDPAAAEVMNALFVNIKVDREERPDIDSVYMAACQMLTGSGGWPLNIFMTPDKRPFFAATYIPKINQFGRVGLIELSQRISDIWHDQPAKIKDSAQSVAEALQREVDNLLWGLVGGNVYRQGGQAFRVVKRLFQGGKLGGVSAHADDGHAICV